jgi:hypothetical protein
MSKINDGGPAFYPSLAKARAILSKIKAAQASEDK